MYDIFYFSKNSKVDENWNLVRSRYPTAQRLTDIGDFDQIKSRSFTKMFWIIWDDLILNDQFNLTEYHATKWDDMYVHVFKNGDFFDGICLFPKNIKISKKEFDHRFFIEKKEVDIQASTPKPYDVYLLNTYDEYLSAIETSTTEMFWAIWNNISIIDQGIFNLQFDRKENHVFKNLCNDSSSYYNGVVLFSKKNVVSKREFDRRYLIDKKEHNQVVSRFRYNRYVIENYDQYVDVLKKETYPLFWCVWPEIEITDDSIFDLYFDPRDGKYDHDRNENHIFKNVCDKLESYYNGLVLFSKNKVISKREFDRRYLIDKKEHDQLVSRFRYPRYKLESYNQYIDILEKSKDIMFWGIWPEIEIIDESIFDLYFDPRDGKYDHDRNENHIFKNLFRNKEQYSYGAVLFSKNKKIGKREFDHRYLIEKKEHDRLISKLKSYDIVFISYEEPNADENYEKLLKRFPRTKRIHKVKGIHQAHIKAAELASTEMFWVVDGDAIILEDFNFDYEISTYERDIVHVWKSQNPINELIYGYGGVKLLPRIMTKQMDANTADMTTAISKKFKAMPGISNVTAFNTDPFSTWKSAFRECVKLSSRIIDRQKDVETEQRLEIWCTMGQDKPYGKYSILGANLGRKYGEENKNNLEKLKMINDFNWLEIEFKKYYD
jgi:hypothetical protein